MYQPIQKVGFAGTRIARVLRKYGMGSNSFRISKEEFWKWAHNTLIFFAPALLVFLMKIQMGGTVQEALLALEIWGINVAIDFLRKYIPDTSV